jgi:hypothetical protein
MDAAAAANNVGNAPAAITGLAATADGCIAMA